MKSWRLGEPRQIVVHGVVQKPLLGGLVFGHVRQRADESHHFAVGADQRTRLEREPKITAVGCAQAEILHQPSAALFEYAVERGAKTIAVERMEHIEPARGRTFERATLEAEQMFRLRAGEDAVRGDVPVPDHVARAGERKRAALDIRDDAVGDAAGKGVLHDREADQHHDEDQTTEQRRADDVVGHEADDGQSGGDGPDHQQKPGRDEQHRTVETMGRKINHQPEAQDRDSKEREPRDAGGDRWIEHRHPDQCAQDRKPAGRDVHVAHMPAAEIEIGKEKHEQGCREDRLARRTPDAFGAGRHVEHLAPETEVDADVDQHRPAQCGGGGKHHAAFDHEQDGEEERKQSGNADDDTVVERETN